MSCHWVMYSTVIPQFGFLFLCQCDKKNPSLMLYYCHHEQTLTQKCFISSLSLTLTKSNLNRIHPNNLSLTPYWPCSIISIRGWCPKSSTSITQQQKPRGSDRRFRQKRLSCLSSADHHVSRQGASAAVTQRVFITEKTREIRLLAVSLSGF